MGVQHSFDSRFVSGSTLNQLCLTTADVSPYLEVEDVTEEDLKKRLSLLGFVIIPRFFDDFFCSNIERTLGFVDEHYKQQRTHINRKKRGATAAQAA